MRFSATTFVAVLLSMSEVISGHPSFFESRAQSKHIRVPIDQLLKGSKVEKSGKGSAKVVSVDTRGSSANDHLFKNTRVRPQGADFSCHNDPCCPDVNTPFHDKTHFDSVVWSQHLGITRRISEAVCPPGGITKSNTLSYSYSINVQVGPDLKFGPAILDKFGIRVGFAYTWGTAETTAYSINCDDGGGFPCFGLFTPRIGVINGVGWIERIGKDGKTNCGNTEKSQMEIHVPIVSTDCKGSRNPCGPAGVYDHCFVTGKQATDLCPRSSLGKKVLPNEKVCPAGLTG